MAKVLGVSLGSHSRVFNLMRAYGVDVDYIYQGEILEYLWIPTVRSKFASLENTGLRDGKLEEYFHQVQQTPSFWEEYFNKSLVDCKNNAGKLVELDGIDQYDAIAISATDNFYKPLQSLLDYLNGSWDKPVIVGGQIVREATLPKIEKLPGRYAINLGSFESFVELSKNNKLPKSGAIGDNRILKIDSDEILRGTSYARCGEVFSINKDDGGMTLSLSDAVIAATFNIFGISKCGNGCDYCYSPLSAVIPEEVWIKYVDYFSRETDNVKLNILDDNPFKHIASYNRVITRALERFKHVEFNSYLDASALVMLPEAEKFFDNLVSNPKVEDVVFFAGRECASGASADRLGRRYDRNIRHQDLLDKEKMKIKQVVAKLEKTGVKYLIDFAYVFGPDDNLEKIKEELMELVHLGSNGTTQGHIQALDVFPGTGCYERYKSEIISDFPGVMVSNLENPAIRAFEKEDYHC